MRRPDGKLTHNLFEEDKGPQDACGIFGVWAPGEEVAKLAFYGCMPCSIAAKNPQELPHQMAREFWYLKIWVWSRKYSPRMI